MEVQLVDTYGNSTDNKKDFKCAFFEGDVPAETYKFNSHAEIDPIFNCLDDNKNVSVFINTKEKILNICLRSDMSDGNYYTTISFTNDEYTQFMKLMNTIIELPVAFVEN